MFKINKSLLGDFIENPRNSYDDKLFLVDFLEACDELQTRGSKSSLEHPLLRKVMSKN